MILGFKDQFVPFVVEGSKTHTIREGERWRAGMRADCYARPRQKDMRLLFRAPVVKVEPIRIHSYEYYQRGPTPLGGNHCLFAKRGPHGEAMLVWINGELLQHDEAESLFRRDGFRDAVMMASYEALLFWGDRLPFAGQIIHWDYAERFSDVTHTCYHLSSSIARRHTA